MSRLLSVLAILIPLSTLTAGDAIADAKAAHAAEMARLKAELLDAIDKRLRDNQRAGRGNDFLLPERKAFAEQGVTPLLPEMQAAVRVYLNGKRKADAALARLVGVEEEEGRVRPAVRKVDTKADLQGALGGSLWDWGDADLYLRPDGRVAHALWDKAGLIKTWEAIDRRTVLIHLEKGRSSNKVAVLAFDEGLTQFRLMTFDGDWSPNPIRRKR